ncbi:MAG: hypothetical protein CL850_04720 [Crocinitomicaceae bacterium]|nr:hypothetical protein [Crocinitomicaceae bacterium]
MTFSSHNSSLIVRFLGFSHLLIALGSGACVIVTLKVLGIEEGFEPSATFISACTGLGYSIQRVIKANLFPKAVPIDRLVFLEKYGKFLVTIWAIAWLAGFWWILNDLGLIAWGLIMVIGGAGLAYAILPWSIKKARSLREVPHMKLPMLSFVWGCATVVLPIYIMGVEVCTIHLAIVFVSRVLYIAGLTVPFDVRDLNVDTLDMKTVPMVRGVENSLWIACGLVVLSGWIWAFLEEYPLFIHSLLTAVFVCPKVHRPYRGEWYYSILLNGMLLLQVFVLFS